MKKLSVILVLIILISPSIVFATSGALKGGTIQYCNGKTYGYHSNHWHVAVKRGEKYYASGSAIYSNPCGSSSSSGSSGASSSGGGYYYGGTTVTKDDYKVEHYIEESDGKYTLYETDTKTDVVGKTVKAVPYNYGGFSVNNSHPNAVLSGTVSSYTTLRLKIYYSRNSYKVTYKYSGVTPEGATPLPEEKTYKYYDAVTVAPKATAPGYTFAGWTQNDKLLEMEKFAIPYSDITIIGTFKPETSKYKVEHYQQNVNDDNYTLVDTKELEGTTDVRVTATPNDYPGFTFDKTVPESILEGNIKGNNSLVLKLYYKRNTHSVTYKYNNEVPEDATVLPETKTYKYGEAIKIEDAATALGYTFSGWNKEDFVMPNEDVVIEGDFKLSNDTKYVIEYYVQNINDDDFSVLDLETLKGTTFTDLNYIDEVVEDNEETTDNKKYYKVKEFDGLTFDKDNPDNVLTGIIEKDGSLILKMYYTRNTYKVSYKYTGNVPEGATPLPSEAEYKFGEEVKVAKDATAPKLVFSGWSKENFKMPAEDVVITGHFEKDKAKEKRNKILTIVGGTTTVTAVAGTSAIIHKKKSKKK